MQIDFENHLLKTFPFIKGKRILLAISGGIDSVVLGYLCQHIKLDFVLAHCNFSLRGKESDGDELFVKNLAQEWGRELFIKKFNTQKIAAERKCSIQVAARELRYDWFQNLAEKWNFDYIFTAHQADDNLETYLINTIRGTGLEGLTGIPEINGMILRPLLPFSRSEIETYAKTSSIFWREDSSNASSKYLRNKIRHEVIPVLKTENPHLLQSFSKTQQHLQEASDLIAECSKLLFEEIVEKKGDELHFDIQKIVE
ncbi:MAG TPA: tRNA lysidine(34) synthetase TilS, partial [Flavobacteriaceae bacterium]|nr:tRNA lysidine(34) synthetase TilS [Flavobacteriaceae bacterium]